MKKNIVILLGLLIAFITGCDPLKDVNAEIDATQTAYTKTVNYTLVSTDYTSYFYSKGSIYKNKYFATVTEAKDSIPTILNKKYPQLGDGSVANIVYSLGPVTFKPADSTYANVAYTVVNPTDYNNAASVTGTTYKDYSAAQVLLFLTYKYPNPVENQLVVLTYLYYESGVTASSGTQVTDSFIYMNGAWQKIYTVSASQYTSASRGTNNYFVASDASSLPSYFNAFLKADPKVMATAKAGDVIYVSYKYTSTYQRVKPLTFDGTNWVVGATTISTANFLKKNGTWILDPTVYYTLVSADYTTIGNFTNVGNATNRANLAQYKNFNISSSGTTVWTDAEIIAALIEFLNVKYPNAVADETVEYKVTYYAYNSGTYSYPVKTFYKTSNGFQYRTPTP